MQLLECIPNLSEGRDVESIRALMRRLRGRDGVWLLDSSSDPDHHRSVLTLAGRRQELVAAMSDLYRIAIPVIDLRRHRGAHPRIGAVDVAPFVPLAGSTGDDAVWAARQLAREVGSRHRLPVFLYEDAATHPARRRLPDIRRGGLAGLARRMREDAAWRPDFGPSELHPTAGATAIGARFFLIAFNVLLDTPDARIARRIARRIREADGGLPAVKALGLALDSMGRAQVSMNLVDYRKTSMAEALEAVQREASGLGCRATDFEIIGLVPEEAARDPLLGRPVPGDRILERRLERAIATATRPTDR